MALLIWWVLAVCIKHVQRRNRCIVVFLQAVSHLGNVSGFDHSLYKRCKSTHVDVDTCDRPFFLCHNLLCIFVQTIRLRRNVPTSSSGRHKIASFQCSRLPFVSGERTLEMTQFVFGKCMVDMLILPKCVYVASHWIVYESSWVGLV